MTVTKAKATKVLNAVRAQCGDGVLEGDVGPELKKDWDWLGSGHPAPYSIVWEEGPFEWAYLFPHGGIEEEFGFRRKDVSGKIPAGVFCEAITSWAVAIVADD